MEDKKNRGLGAKYFLGGVLAACMAMTLLYFLLMWLPLGGSPSKPDSIQAQRKIKEIQRLINRNYLGQVDEEQQTDYMFLGLVAGLGDRYSTYYTAEEYASIKKEQEGSYVGIGITIAQQSEGGRLVVLACVEDSPADRAGVQVGDQIQTINGKDTEGMTSSQAVELIQQSGEEKIHLSLIREGSQEPLTVEVTRETVEVKSVEAEVLDSDMGYIRITEFTGVTAQQFEDALARLQGEKIKSLIIDLRDNPGGLVDAVCDTLSQILPKGVIVYTEDKDGNRKERDCEGKTPLELPLVVLVNGSSASSAEIFAGAVQDYQIGTIVGTTTYGKGIVQNTYHLSDDSVVKLTVSHYYTPKGNDIHGRGIRPDVEVDQAEDTDTDAQLEKAKELLQS